MSRHWLLESAASASASGDVPTSLALDGDLSARWTSVARACKLDMDALANAVASYFGLARADLSLLDPAFARRTTESVARTHAILPLCVDGQHALCAMADPTDSAVVDELAFALGMPITTVIAAPGEIDSRLAEVFGNADGTLDDWGQVSSSLLAAELILRRKDGVVLAPSSSATAKLFAELLRRGVHVNASDIHIQPYGSGAVVRNRVDGVLYRTLDIPEKVHAHLVRHVKAVAGMDPTQHMVPQDGELRMELEHKEIDLRLSIIPVGTSERLVALLLPQNQVRALDLLRLDDYEQQRLQRLAGNADGMILMTGPTGSGKTSLLYAMLAEKNVPNINIMTVEEPVEYRLRGASQINVDPRTGLTFAASLRSILRQDPDVVMIGEIRDEETAGIAAQAAMTGHFVLSTVHTLDALLATVRMQDLGVSSATLADALQAVASQRLVRALCKHCRAPLPTEDFTDDDRRFSELWSAPAWQAVGCDECRSTGYSGRVPVLEVVEMTGELRKHLRDKTKNLEELEMIAADGGTRFLAEGFARRVEEGTTTVAEVLRVYGQGFFPRLQRALELGRVVGNNKE